jgi:tRNA nucleotidyltransferase (CCA-adding enzyme)
MKFTDKQLKHRILKDRYNSIIFEKGRAIGVYLVGGYIRDALMGLRSSDRDYIVDGDLKAFVNEIRDIFGGTIIEFKREGFIRLGFREGLTFDFSKPQGSLTEDLSKRDFTINAIAWSPEEGMIDIYNGAADITRKIIRCISKDNLIADPLRILRAYRFAAQFNGSIETNTHNYIKILQNNIIKVSPERITLEFSHLLNSEKAPKYLKLAFHDGVLSSILPIQSRQLEHNIGEVSKLQKRILKVLPLKIKVILNNIFSQNLTYKGLLCLELLLKKKKTVSNISIKHLRLSNIVQKRIILAHQGMYFIGNINDLQGELFDLFMFCKEAIIDVLILTDRLDLLDDYKRFKMIWRAGLISSREVIDIPGIESGPEIGRMIYELKKAQFEKRIRTKKEAMKYITTLL